ncbi:MAG: hypothetical protein ACRDRC_05730 [Pseudonocardiaceae bacterium]
MADGGTVLTTHIDRHHTTSTPTELLMRQGLAIAEEAGETVGALRRYLGVARRTGTLDDVATELADVVITAYTTAHRLGIDLPAAIDTKTQIIFSRGWRDPR